MCMFPMIDFYCESIDASESTKRHHEEVLERIFKQLSVFGVVLKDCSIDGISGAVLQQWFNAFKKDHAPTTVNNNVVTLNPFLLWAHTIYPDSIGNFSGVLKTVRLPKENQISEDKRPKDKYYTHDQIAKLLKIPRPSDDSPLKKRNRAIIAMYLASGLRAEELCSLKIGSLTDHGHGYVYVKRKGGSWTKTEVAEFVYPYLETYLATRDDRNNPDAFLFVTINGEPCNRVQLYKAMRTQQRKVVGNDYACGNHVLRHVFVSETEKIGGGAVARDLANHRSIVITNRYDHSTAEQRRKAVDSLNYLQ